MRRHVAPLRHRQTVPARSTIAPWYVATLVFQGVPLAGIWPIPALPLLAVLAEHRQTLYAATPLPVLLLWQTRQPDARLHYSPSFLRQAVWWADFVALFPVRVLLHVGGS